MTHSSTFRTLTLTGLAVFVTSTTLPASAALRVGATAMRPATSFTASYTGTFSSKACTLYQKNGKVKFTGSGTATGLGSSKEKASVTFSANFYCIASGGKGTLSATNSKDKIKVTLGGNPCQYPVSFTITGGKGKFVNATGGGTVSAVCNGSSYTDTWSGTLTY